MNKLLLIKTLPHLIPLFINKDQLTIYSQINSIDIYSFFQRIKLVSIKDLTFTYLLRYLQSFELKEFKSQSKTLLKENYFKRVNQVSEILQYSIKGDTVSIWLIGYDHPLRLEFFGEVCETINIYDEIYERKIINASFIILSDFIPEDSLDISSIKINFPLQNFNKEKQQEDFDLKTYIFSNSFIPSQNNQKDSFINTDFQYPQLYYSRFDILENDIKKFEINGYQIFIRTKNLENLSENILKYTKNIQDRLKKNLLSKDFLDLLSFSIIKNLPHINLPAGFISENLKILILTDRELFGSIFLTRPENVKNITNNIKKLLLQFEGNILIGDYVVHEDYGLAIYAGLTQELIDNKNMEYLLLKYAKEDELYVPIHQIEKITKYIGSNNSEPKLTRLGKTSWESIKTRIKKSTILVAKELIEHSAKRQNSKAIKINNQDSKDYLQFVNEFKYVETNDQLKAINEIISDLEKDIPMNRLLIGDVGFGKTEVFIRAIFKVIEAGEQVGILAPTTILTAQHYSVLKDRFKNFPFKIEYLSRFNSKQKNLAIINNINEGKIDIVVGTHRLLSSDIKFKKLGLIIVDEEQRFGVKQKEKIKKINYGVHLLSVSATPIPRTLSMALSSIQDISIISQPPQNRKSIITEVIKDDWNKVAQAIKKEMDRSGQLYFLHNEINTINQLKQKLNDLTPMVRFAMVHGQMASNELEKIMTDFYQYKYDCLISTTIIENGLDVPNVNTIIINKANKLGLSQLYQLRGRVGRSERQSYCYLLYDGKSLDEKPKLDNKKNHNLKYLERMQSLVENQDLGSGFRIASKDLEIRGAGNLLGEEQSGNISTIGYALYMEILSQEVEKLKMNYQS